MDHMDASTRRLHSPCCPPWTFKCFLSLKLSAEGFREGSLGSSSLCLHSSDICRRVRKKGKARLARSGLLAGRRLHAGISSAQWDATAACFVFPPSRLPSTCTSAHVVVGGATWQRGDSRKTKTSRLDIFSCLFDCSLMSVYNLIFSFSFSLLLFFCTAQRPGDKHLSGSWQAALHAGGVGQEDPTLFRAAAGRPSHPPASRWVGHIRKLIASFKEVRTTFSEDPSNFLPQTQLLSRVCLCVLCISKGFVAPTIGIILQVD